MTITDPIADMATLIRNGSRAHREKVDIRASNIIEGILEILKKERFIQNFKKASDDNKQGSIRVYLRFDKDKNPSIRNIKRVSRSGLRVYKRKNELKPILGGLGIAIISTSQGLFTDREARERSLGGEVLLEVW